MNSEQFKEVRSDEWAEFTSQFQTVSSEPNAWTMVCKKRSGETVSYVTYGDQKRYFINEGANNPQLDTGFSHLLTKVEEGRQAARIEDGNRLHLQHQHLVPFHLRFQLGKDPFGRCEEGSCNPRRKEGC